MAAAAMREWGGPTGGIYSNVSYCGRSAVPVHCFAKGLHYHLHGDTPGKRQNDDDKAVGRPPR